MKLFYAALLVLSAVPALVAASDTDNATCVALSERVSAAAELKSDGIPVEEATSRLSAPPDDPAVDKSSFDNLISGAIRAAYMMGMSPDDSGAYYLRQCNINN